MKRQDRISLTIIAISVIAVAASASMASNLLPIGAVRIWSVLSLFLIPLALLGGWRLGTRDSRAHLSGIETGVKTVMSAADRTARIRNSAAQPRPVHAQPREIATLQLPDPQIISTEIPESEVIDL